MNYAVVTGYRSWAFTVLHSAQIKCLLFRQLSISVPLSLSFLLSLPLLSPSPCPTPQTLEQYAPSYLLDQFRHYIQ